MDHLDKVLMIQIYEHYIKHLQNENENTQIIETRAQPQEQELNIKSVTLYIKKFSSCIRNAVHMYVDNDNDITDTATSTNSDFFTTNENTTENTNETTINMPWIKYTFPQSSTVSLKKIVVRRPPCTDMQNAYIECRDSTDTLVYKSNSITENSLSSNYIFQIPNIIPVIN